MIRMRDKNLNLKQFNIQLEKVIFQCKLTDELFLRTPVFDSPTRPIDPETVHIIYPKNYRLIRSLCIISWYLPEMLHWRVLLDLSSKTFSHFNRKQQLEIQLLLSSKENMVTYLYRTKRYTGSQLFGNILGNDLRELEETLKFIRKKYRTPQYPIRRRGYKDKGARKLPHQWLPKFDSTLTEIQLKKEKEALLQQKTINRILKLLSERT